MRGGLRGSDWRPFHVVDIGSVGALLSGSALTDPSVFTLPFDGHYTDVSMRATVVPNRNAIFLSIATGLAVALGAGTVATAVHAGDHPIYPDCRPEFWTRSTGWRGSPTRGSATPTCRWSPRSCTSTSPRSNTYSRNQ